MDSEELGKFRYTMLTNKRYSAVLIVDIDQPAPGAPNQLSGRTAIQAF